MHSVMGCIMHSRVYSIWDSMKRISMSFLEAIIVGKWKISDTQAFAWKKTFYILPTGCNRLQDIAIAILKTCFDRKISSPVYMCLST